MVLVREFDREDEKDMPDDTTTSAMTPQRTETDAERIARLESELKAAGRVNHLLQEAGTKIVWNNEHLRAEMRAVVLDLAQARFLEPSKKLADTAAELDAMVDLPGTMSRLVLAMEKAK